MTKVKLRVTRISDAELIQNCLASQAAMVRNAGMLPGGEKYVAQVAAALTPFADATQAVAETTARLRALVSAKNAYRKRLEAVYRNLANYVDLQAMHNAAAIHAAGLLETNEPRPVHMTPVRGLKVVPSVKEGELLARWKPVRRAVCYEVQVCKDADRAPTTWVNKCIVPRARCRLNHDLLSGSKVWVHVRAVGTRGAGAWSDAIRKTVP